MQSDSSPLSIHFGLPRPLRQFFLLMGGIWLVMALILIAVIGLRSDFLAFYTAGYAVAQGTPNALYDDVLFRQWQYSWVGAWGNVTEYLYFPPFATFYLPFTALPLVGARVLGFLLGLGALAAAVRISKVWHRLRGWESALALFAFPATYSSLLIGQNTPLTLLLFCAVATWLYRGQRPFLLGVVAGLALYKPHFVLPLLVVLLVTRAWRSLVAFGLTGLTLLAGSFLFAPQATIYYLWLKRNDTGEIIAQSANAAPYVALLRHLDGPYAAALAILIALCVFILLTAAWGRPAAFTPTRYHHALLWSAPTLITPFIATYDLLLLALPLAILVPHLRGDRPLQIVVAFVWLTPLCNLLFGHTVVLSVWATLALFLLCAWRTMITPRLLTRLEHTTAA